ncbi:MAG: hypothetical protein ABJA50_14195, partial [Chloroflexota bacterium]
MESTTDLPDGGRARDVSARLWSARGFFWGLASIGLAFMGQQALVTEGNTGVSWVCYMLAILLLLASLSHPSSALLRRVWSQGPSTGDAEAISVPALTAAVKPATLRARLSWLVTAPLLALSLVLAVASAYMLWRDITSPLGGWLWAFALACLILSFLGAPSSSPSSSPSTEPDTQSKGLPGPYSDFFARGVPLLAVRWEV